MRVVVGLCAALTAGCFSTSGRGEDAARPDDGGVLEDTAVGPDAQPDAPLPTDASPDAPSCEPVEERSIRFCVLTPTGTIPAGEPYALRIERSSCLCARRSCGVRVREGRVELSVETCGPELVCDECTTEVECALPPLPEGTHEVYVDGVLSGTVRAAPRRVVMDAQPACWAVPEEPDEGLRCDASLVARPGPDELCHRRLEDVGTFVSFDVAFDCGGCFDWSAGCEAIRESPRSVLLRPRLQTCACVESCGCDPDVCFPQTVRCQTPALRDGEYDVILEGPDGTRASVSRLEVRDVGSPGPVECTTLP
jgi:hypothetical protein